MCASVTVLLLCFVCMLHGFCFSGSTGWDSICSGFIHSVMSSCLIIKSIFLSNSHYYRAHNTFSKKRNAPCSAIHFHSAIVNGKVTMTILSHSDSHSVTTLYVSGEKRKASLEMLNFYFKAITDYFYESVDWD